jgi:hypothetical protein
MPTELSKPVSRVVGLRDGGLVVTVCKDGIRLRASGKKKTVMVTYKQLAKIGLQNSGYYLSEEEWTKPVQAMRSLGRKRKLN